MWHLGRVVGTLVQPCSHGWAPREYPYNATATPYVGGLERRLRRLSVRDQVILALYKVAMFLRTIDNRDHHDLRIFIEDVTMESGVV